MPLKKSRSKWQMSYSPVRMKAAAKGKIVVFTAPSGAGKTTLVRHLLKRYADQLAFSVSATTRPAREGEVHGSDYYFLSRAEFDRRVAAGEFLEFEEVYEDQYYGTLRSELERLWRSGKAVLFDMDVNGAAAVKAAYPDVTRVVFVAPPSPEILFERLRRRGTESEASLNKRIARAREELNQRDAFDLVLVNDDLDLAKAEAERIVAQWLATS